MPLQPFRLFGERKPIAGNVFECLSDIRLGCLCCALLRMDSATAILISAGVHLVANIKTISGNASFHGTMDIFLPSVWWS
jgi:hypothetical protein